MSLSRSRVLNQFKEMRVIVSQRNERRLCGHRRIPIITSERVKYSERQILMKQNQSDSIWSPESKAGSTVLAFDDIIYSRITLKFKRSNRNIRMKFHELGKLYLNSS